MAETELSEMMDEGKEVTARVLEIKGGSNLGPNFSYGCGVEITKKKTPPRVWELATKELVTYARLAKELDLTKSLLFRQSANELRNATSSRIEKINEILERK